MISLTGDDISIINGRQLYDLADGDVVSLDAPNNLADGKRGKNGNSIIALNSTGKIVNVTIRVLKASPDDKFFNRQMNQYLNAKAAYVLMNGEFIKKSGDGAGNITSDIYTLGGGYVSKLPNSKENVEGDTEQGVTIYTLQFMNSDRIIA